MAALLAQMSQLMMKFQQIPSLPQPESIQPLAQPISNANQAVARRENTRYENLDLLYLFADPLVKMANGQILSCGNQLSIGEEFQKIKMFLESTGKDIRLRKEAMISDQLSTILNRSSKVIHISCHGGWEKQFYLQIEKNIGFDYQLFENCLKSTLSDISYKSLKLVFVSACHSQQIGQAFVNANVPLVIAVNSLSLVADSVCVYFSNVFYKNLFSGETPNESFDIAKKEV